LNVFKIGIQNLAPEIIAPPNPDGQLSYIRQAGSAPTSSRAAEGSAKPNPCGDGAPRGDPANCAAAFYSQ